MIFNTVSKFKNGRIFDIIVCFLIYSFVMTLNGCVSTETKDITREYIPLETGFHIIKIMMNDGSEINVADKEAKFLKEYKGQKNVILYYEKDSAKVSEDVIRVSSKIKSVELKDVYSVVVEKREGNVALTVLAVGLVVAGVLIIIAVAAFGGNSATSSSSVFGGGKFSCPYVYTYNGKEFNLESETFAGAILKAVERKAYDNLCNLAPVEGKLILKITNESPETDFVNEMSIIAADTKKNEKVIPDYKGMLHTVSAPVLPYICTDLSGKNMKELVINKDNKVWESDIENMDLSGEENLKDGLILFFKKPQNAVKSKLVVNGVNTELTVAAFHELIRIKGKNKREWMNSLEGNTVETKRFLNFFRREGMLHVKLWNNNEWVEQTIIPDPGPLISKDQIALLDLNGISGETLMVKLESTTDLWKINQVYMDFTDDDVIISNKLKLRLAVSQNGENVKNLLDNDDPQYLKLAPGDYTVLSYQDIPLKPDMKRNYILITKGYYEPLYEYTSDEETELYNKVMDEPLYGLKYFMDQWKEMKEYR